MNWCDINKVLPEDNQEITVYHEGLKKELHRTFSLKFWEEYKRVPWCNEFCKKWKPRE